MQTTEKRRTEEQVVDELRPWAQATGAHLEHVGGDDHPGDIVLTITANSVAATDCQRLVIEARDQASPKGRKAVTDDLSTAMSQRGANTAIYLSRTAAGLAREIGDWCEGVTALAPG